jgi:hypothetical protein
MYLLLTSFEDFQNATAEPPPKAYLCLPSECRRAANWLLLVLEALVLEEIQGTLYSLIHVVRSSQKSLQKTSWVF